MTKPEVYVSISGVSKFSQKCPYLILIHPVEEYTERSEGSDCDFSSRLARNWKQASEQLTQ